MAKDVQSQILEQLQASERSARRRRLGNDFILGIPAMIVISFLVYVYLIQ